MSFRRYACICIVLGCNKDHYGNCIAKSCPKGPAWFNKPSVDNLAHDVEVECSNMGLCDHITGLCKCRDGYEGEACERNSCGGRSKPTGNAKISIPCSNRGRCVSMRQLAAYAKDNTLSYYSDPKGLPTTSSVTYGSAANASTWDADHIYGCIADDYGYYPTSSAHTGDDGSGSQASSHDFAHNITSSVGFSLTKKQCPFTYNYQQLQNAFTDTNISALNYTITIQSLSCSASSGTAYLKFRDAKSVAIDASVATVFDIEFILKSISTIGSISVYYDPTSYSNTTLFCDASTPPTVSVSFLSELGLLPLLEIEHNLLSGGSATITINYAQRSDNADFILQECGGHGSCDDATGECVCWENWGSSDGYSGAIGTTGDCGYNLIV